MMRGCAVSIVIPTQASENVAEIDRSGQGPPIRPCADASG